ncbi:MAG TPA: hypothetical protein VKU85_17700, partial [bacterium]|nr:hypothetical protein [bacterium]
MRFPRALRSVAAAALAVASLSGCASYTQKALAVRDPLIQGDLESAQAFLEEKTPGGKGLPYLFELGLVQRARGDFQASNATFESAELLVDDLYTKSVSKEILAFATSDETIPYSGETWERVLVNYYRALNYIDLGDFEAALVECRKLNQKLRVYVDSDDDPPTYRTDAFAQYVTSILYEISGDLNDAWVSLRLAEEGYAHYAEAYGVQAPPSLVPDYLRLALDHGYADDPASVREKYADVKYTPTSELLKQGEIVLLYEEGFIAPKIQEDVFLPILKTEWEDDHESYARRLSRPGYRHRKYKKTELEYLLRIALPTYQPRAPGDRPGYAKVGAGGKSAQTVIAEDLDAIARKGLEDRMGGILFRTIVRALGKYALTRGVEKETGKIGGLLANIVTAATEKADTRSWITLPRTVQIARIVVPPGSHDV